MVQERYRKDYLGEFIIANTKLKNGKKQQQREWIPNLIKNQHISARAAAFFGKVESKFFDEGKVERHKGGHLGKFKLQTYGIGDTWKNINLNFSFINDIGLLDEIIKAGIQEKTAVYTNSVNCIKRPGEFFLLPYNLKMPSPAGILYLAAFDEHKEIFICGAEQYGVDALASNKILKSVSRVIGCYKNTKFYFVVNKQRHIPNEWKKFPNVQLMNHSKFVSYCDL